MDNFKKILVTGGAGFIGGAVVRNLLLNTNSIIYNIDKISYASDLTSIKNISSSKIRHFHHKLDLTNFCSLDKILKEIQPNLIIHLAAESHVDRSISSPNIFIESNILGTFNLLEATRNYWNSLEMKSKKIFRFHHVSTDEVFGSLKANEFFDESSNYSPRSPYSASKAASDHLVNSWHNTYGIPTIISNCGNNYGPYQFPEKLIPLTILKALNEENIPVYGNGQNIRDWLYVDDHVSAIFEIIKKGKIGGHYCVGGNNPLSNLEVVEMICSILDDLNPKSFSHKKLIKFVIDRPGHDERYALENSLIKNELGWEPKYNFSLGLKKTIKWYLKNTKWCYEVMRRGSYKGNRLGL